MFPTKIKGTIIRLSTLFPLFFFSRHLPSPHFPASLAVGISHMDCYSAKGMWISIRPGS